MRTAHSLGVLALGLGLASTGAAHAAAELAIYEGGLVFVDRAASEVFSAPIEIAAPGVLRGLARESGERYWVVSDDTIGTWNAATGAFEVELQDGGAYDAFADVAVWNGRVFVVTLPPVVAQPRIFELVGGALEPVIQLADVADWFLPALFTDASGLHVAYTAKGFKATVLRIHPDQHTTEPVWQGSGASHHDYHAVARLEATKLLVVADDGVTERLDQQTGQSFTAGRMLAPSSVGFDYPVIEGIAPAPTVGCVPSRTTACLHGRFKVQVTWGAAKKKANQVPQTPSTVQLTFDHPANEDYQLAVKIVNRCATAQRFEVVTGGFTGQALQLTVTDMRTGKKVTLAKAANASYASLTDKTTFTCP